MPPQGIHEAIEPKLVPETLAEVRQAYLRELVRGRDRLWRPIGFQGRDTINTEGRIIDHMAAIVLFSI